jgi:SH3 domain-containing YSC84-like protein 1
MRKLVSAISLSALLLAAGAAWSQDTKDTADQAKNKPEERVVKANDVFKQMVNAPDTGIPQDLLGKAYCIGIIPGVKKIAIGALGGEHGAGIVTCRKNDGRGPWGPPSAFAISGGSFGLQLGYSDTDYVLLFMTKDGMNKLLNNKFTIGADASGAAGPVGRTAAAATDAQLHAEILTYSRARGLFAGVSLNGAVLRPSPDDNRMLYGKDVSAKTLLLEGNVAPPAVAVPLLATLNKFSPEQQAKANE